MADDRAKYPPNIQKLFTPKPSLLYKGQTDYASEDRKTRIVTPISLWKNHINSYIEEAKSNETSKVHEEQANSDKKLLKKKSQQESFNRQLKEWNDPEAFSKHQQEVSKDSSRTVFLARLSYTLTETDISKSLSKYGMIESIRIIRDRSSRPRGYAFVLFEKDLYAKNCISELASQGIRIPDSSGNISRTALVDIERGSLVRNWKPRRLGGGLGGRHYTKPDSRSSKVASAAASGRTLFNNGYPNQNHLTSQSYGPYKSYRPQRQGFHSDSRKKDLLVKDKYAKYSSLPSDSPSYRSSNDGSRSRSIRNIRQRD